MLALAIKRTSLGLFARLSSTRAAAAFSVSFSTSTEGETYFQRGFAAIRDKQKVFNINNDKRFSETLRKIEDSNPKAYKVKETDEEIIWKRDVSKDKAIYKEIIIDNKIDTLTKALNYAISKYGHKKFLGTREVLGEVDEKQKDKKILKKLVLGEYKWMTFNEAHSTSSSFGKGLKELGIASEESIVIYADTRAEWLMAALGAFSQSITVGTLYTNLADDAIIHGLNETEVSLVITSHDLLPKFKTLLVHCPLVKTIIVMEDQISPTDTSGYMPGVDILMFQSIVKLGETSTVDITPPTSDTPAIIMYTSGSTGVPKGVVLTHGNMISTTTCLMFMEPFYPDDVYIAYLPLAHALELLSECTMMLFGNPVGYSSPNTLSDFSAKVRRGQKGDASVLQPTIMSMVPLILDKIYKNILDNISQQSTSFQNAFEILYQYKLERYKNNKRTPIIDKIVFNKMKGLLGGKLRYAIIGGAPLSPQTHEFMRVCLGLILVQGFSLTETTCTGTVMEPDDKSTGKVGPPMAGMEVKIVNWEEGSYRVTDYPRPRGEIIIGGKSVASGYFKNDQKTEKYFYTTEDGKRWFRTGDIGEVFEDGSFKIIDRKKELVKLQMGEYVSLGRVEAQLKTHPLIENICVYGDPYKSFTVAVVVPARNSLEKLGKDLGKTNLNHQELCQDKEIVKAVVTILHTHGTQCTLNKWEIPRTVSLTTDMWTPDSGLVTAAFKIRRKHVYDQYQDQIDTMYRDTG